MERGKMSEVKKELNYHLLTPNLRAGYRHGQAYYSAFQSILAAVEGKIPAIKLTIVPSEEINKLKERVVELEKKLGIYQLESFGIFDEWADIQKDISSITTNKPKE